MIALEITLYITTILLLIIICKVKNKINNIKEMISDILIMISSVFGTIGAFNLTLLKGLKSNIDFFENSVFFIIISLVSLIAIYLIYFNDKGNNRFIWFLSEIFMAFGLNIILLGIVYLYQGIGHLSDDILKENFSIFFENKDDSISKEQLFNLRISGVFFILIIGMLSIVLALSLNSYRQNKTEEFNIKHNK